MAEDAVVLTVVASEPEAEILCGLLRTNGIECNYRDTDRIDSSLEEFTATGPQEVLVHSEDLQRAREFLPPTETA